MSDKKKPEPDLTPAAPWRPGQPLLAADASKPADEKVNDELAEVIAAVQEDGVAYTRNVATKWGKLKIPRGHKASRNDLRSMLVPHRRRIVATILQLMRYSKKDTVRLDAARLALLYIDGPPDAVLASDLTDEELLEMAMRRASDKAKVVGGAQ